MCFMSLAQSIQQALMVASAIPIKRTARACCNRHSWTAYRDPARESVCNSYHKPAQQDYNGNTRTESCCAPSVHCGARTLGPPIRDLNIILLDNRPQFFSKFSVALCASLGLKKVNEMENNSQANAQVESFINTLLARLGHYPDQCQKDLNTFIHPMLYG